MEQFRTCDGRGEENAPMNCSSPPRPRYQTVLPVRRRMEFNIVTVAVCRCWSGERERRAE